ncbi:MAG: energy transducer TonB [Planctomycetes bacterium]|nr:energy transducer TonB [Planctomycetota bacterium]
MPSAILQRWNDPRERVTHPLCSRRALIVSAAIHIGIGAVLLVTIAPIVNRPDRASKPETRVSIRWEVSQRSRRRVETHRAARSESALESPEAAVADPAPRFVGVGGRGASVMTARAPRAADASAIPVEEAERTAIDAISSLPPPTPPPSAVLPEHELSKTVGVEAEAVLESPIDPSYPKSCVRRGHEGTVVLRIEIDARGRVTAATVVEPSCCADLDDAAREAALEMRYRPATLDGAPVASTTTLRIRFELTRR